MKTIEYTPPFISWKSRAEMSSMFTRTLCALTAVMVGVYVLDLFFVSGFGGLIIPLFYLAGGGCGGSGGGSTPFLCTWNGNRFVFDNDFLLSGSSTFFPDFETGQRRYLEGNVAPDLYNIINTFSFKNEKIAFQIREIEPEESFIHHLSLTRILYPKEGELIVDAGHKDFYIFEKEELTHNEGVKKQRVLAQGKDNLDFLTASAFHEKGKNTKNEHMLEAGESVEIHGNIRSQLLKSSPLFLLIGSRYRDWTAGEILEFKQEPKKSILSPFGRWSVVALPKIAGRILFMVVFSVVLWAVALVDSGRGEEKRSSQSDNALLSGAFSVPRAHADAPAGGGGGGGGGGGSHSLNVTYWNWAENKFKTVHIIQPRYRYSVIEAIRIPAKNAVSTSGEVRVRITATKRHALNSVSFFVPKKKYTSRAEKLSLSRVFHSRLQKNYTTSMNEELSNKYMHTIPGDVVDVAFSLPSKKRTSEESEAYLLGAVGFYTPLSSEGARHAGNWVQGLDKESRTRLSEMYALRNYTNPNRKPVLS